MKKVICLVQFCFKGSAHLFHPFLRKQFSHVWVGMPDKTQCNNDSPQSGGVLTVGYSAANSLPVRWVY
jgi:hypothetical protein